jgi:uncharacterized protein YjiS (DUF1127 family)
MNFAAPSAAVARVGEAIARIRTRYAGSERRRRDALWLERSTDSHLRDIGLRRSDIRAAVYGGRAA